MGFNTLFMNLKKVLLLCFLVFSFASNLDAQVFDPVSWETKTEQISDTEYDLIATATIDTGWHLYSQLVPDGGPIPTTFTYTTDANFELSGKTLEDKGHTVDDPVFEMRIKFFENKAEFRQRIKILNSELSLVKGEVEFMVCDDEKCLPPNYIDLEFNLKSAADVKEAATSTTIDFSGTPSKILEPVKWMGSVEKLSATEFILVSTATIDEGWKLYAQNIAEGGPIPTSFEYTLEKGVHLVGDTYEEKGLESVDKVFDMKIKYFKNKTEFRQKIKVLDTAITTVESEVGFMSCDDTQCTAPTYVDLKYDLTKTTAATSDISGNSDSSDDDSSKGLWSILL